MTILMRSTVYLVADKCVYWVCCAGLRSVLPEMLPISFWEASGEFRGGARGAVAPPSLKFKGIQETLCIDIKMS